MINAGKSRFYTRSPRKISKNSLLLHEIKFQESAHSFPSIQQKHGRKVSNENPTKT